MLSDSSSGPLCFEFKYCQNQLCLSFGVDKIKYQSCIGINVINKALSPKISDLVPIVERIIIIMEASKLAELLAMPSGVSFGSLRSTFKYCHGQLCLSSFWWGSIK
ncbi:Hypothetical predicted protein [Octopus vulgaris]|uniref:Uncharacterized protein n=1 Tax=Octopus vulgaris TaxID=6645 RepID=A0AA36F6Q7_OCTVU|nr:Hypothetical predicted protein [Octopus vulgaris]